MLGEADVAPAIAVSDFEAAKKFYGETLGLAKETESPGGATFKSGNSHVFVYPSPSAGTNQATYAGWVVADVSATAEALKAKGVALEHYDTMPGVTLDGDVHNMGELQAIWFKDPSGNILSVSNMQG